MIETNRVSTRCLAAALTLAVMASLLIACNTDRTLTPREKYSLTEEEAAAWERFYLAEAESISVRLWGHIGRGEFDKAMLLVRRFDDPKMQEIFEQRIENLWKIMVNWPADQLLKEPQIGMGSGRTVGFDTWGDLWTNDFQRVVLAEDSITVYFVFDGHWETEQAPIYAAVACGDFGTEQIHWRPFSHLVLYDDESPETIKALGQGYRAQSLEEFCDYLRTRTFGSFRL